MIGEGSNLELKADALDLIMQILKDHEKNLGELSVRTEKLFEERRRERKE